MRFLLATLILLLAAPLRAETPRVVADIAPVHGIVAEVMEGVGSPDLLLSPGVSPHHVTLRPSQARAMQKADLVVWIGPALTPWLEKALESLRRGEQIALLELPGTIVLPLRDHADDAQDREHGAEHGHAQGHGDDHAQGAASPRVHDHGHDHAGGPDPHAWLDPRNAALWAGAIAERLSRIDPTNADRYRANARAFADRMHVLEDEIAARLADTGPHLAYHDAFQYFETRFGLKLAGVIAAGDAAGPGAAHLSALRRHLAEKGVACAFREPQLDPRLMQAALEGLDLRIGVLDPLGRDLEPGPGFYDSLLRNLAAGFAQCRHGS